MSYQVKFWSSFDKRINSTKQPATTGQLYNCIVKSETGIINPTVELTLAATTDPAYTYCQIPAFGRYYWVREWTFTDRKWVATLECDPLGSYKTAIGNSTHYVLRSASAKSEYVIDTFYPAASEGSPLVTQGTTSTWWTVSTNLSSGTFVLGLRGKVETTQPSGGITYVALTPAQFRTLINKIFQNDLQYFLQGGTLDISDTLTRMVFDPEQYVVSCIWHPGSVTSTSTSSGIDIGYWAFSGTYNIVNPTSFYSFTQRIQLPQHPNAASRGKYLNAPPFTMHAVFLPRLGIVDLSGKIPANAADIVVTLNVDPISGQGLYYLYYTTVHNSNTTYLIDMIQVQIGVEVPLSSTARTFSDILSTISSVGNVLGDVASLNFGGAVSDILSCLNIYQPHINDIGAASGYLGIGTADPSVPFLVSQRMLPVDDDPTENGYPYCKSVQLSTLSGYIKVLHGDMEVSGATIGELEAIKNYLEGGFFYE